MGTGARGGAGKKTDRGRVSEQVAPGEHRAPAPSGARRPRPDPPTPHSSAAALLLRRWLRALAAPERSTRRWPRDALGCRDAENHLLATSRVRQAGAAGTSGACVPPDGRRRQRSKRAGHSVPAVSTCLSKSRLKWEESQPPLGPRSAARSARPQPRGLGASRRPCADCFRRACQVLSVVSDRCSFRVNNFG